jgi:hypothetical protein
MERRCEAGETDDAATGLAGGTKTGGEEGRRAAVWVSPERCQRQA